MCRFGRDLRFAGEEDKQTTGDYTEHEQMNFPWFCDFCGYAKGHWGATD